MRPVPLAALAVFAFPLFAQAPLVEKIEVSVVNVDVTVTDRHGNPVHGLTRDDFEIFEDGVIQPISNFYVVEGSTGFSRSNLPAEAGAPSDDRFRRKVLLIIDRHSLTPYERDRALARIEEFINDRFRGGEYDWSIAAVDTTLRMLLPPTSDKRAIHDALDQIRKGRMPRPPDSPNPTEAQLWEAALAGRNTVDALVEAVRAFGAADGKKIVLLLSGQLLPNNWNVAIGRYRWSLNLELEKFMTLTRNELIEEANASNVNLYIVNPEASNDSSMYWIARETGGRLLPGNRVADSLSRFDAGSSNFYSLGYRPTHADDGMYHRIKVVLKNGSYALQYRTGYSSLPDQQQITRTLGSSFGTFMMSGSAIPVSVTFEKQRDADEAVIMWMKTTVPTEKLTFVPTADGSSSRVDIYISIFDSMGTNVWSVQLTRDANLAKNDSSAGTFNEKTEVYLVKGKPYRVVVAVRDQLSEAVGVTQQVVKF